MERKIELFQWIVLRLKAGSLVLRAFSPQPACLTASFHPNTNSSEGEVRVWLEQYICVHLSTQQCPQDTWFPLPPTPADHR